MIRALLSAGKEYICVMRVHSAVLENKVKEALDEFCGVIYQKPPLRSSVKRRLRTRNIYYLKFLEMKDKNVLFKVGCEAGTYIRKLVHDLGEALGCGAHMRELRRTRVGPFSEDEGMVTLHDLSYMHALWQETEDEEIIRKIIHPMEKALKLIPKIYIRDSAVNAICHGANLTAPGVLSLETEIKPNHIIAVLTQKGEAVALAKAQYSTTKIFDLEHGFIAKTQRVLMPRDVYPKMWRSNN